MLFCDDCGKLKKKVKRGRDVIHVCAQCDPITIAPGGNRPGRKPASRDTQKPTQFQRADQLSASASEPRAGPARAAQARQAIEEIPVRKGDPPEGAGPYFPFPEMRPGQARFVKDVREALQEQRILVAQAPTGIGKTAGVLAPALEVARETRSRIFFLTPKQSQHKVVVDPLRLAERAAGEDLIVSDMISKQAMCPRPEADMLNGRAFGEWCTNEMANNRCSYYKNDETETIQTFANKIHHVERAVDVAASDHVCPYAALTEVARVANVVVMDYNHFFSDMLENTLERLRLSLDNAILVIDEAHNLPDRILDHLTTVLHPAQVGQASDEARGVGAYAEARFLEKLRDWLDTLESDQEKEMEPDELSFAVESAIHKAFRMGKPDTHDVIDQLKKVGEQVLKKEARSAAMEVAEFLELWPPSARYREKKVLRRYSPDHGGVVHQILDAAVLARPIFDQVRGAVLMSGTMFPMEMYASILGVPKERAQCELYQNPFPQENRRVAIDTSVSSSYRERGPDTYKAIGERIAQVCQATPGNVAVFFPSYSFQDQVLGAMPPVDRIMINEERGLNKTQREGLVHDLRQAGGRALLMGVMGGSLSEGYDFVQDGENLLPSVLVVGIPYAPPTLEVKARQAFFDDAFGNGRGWLYGYLAPATQKVLQAAGRAIRASHHKGFIGLLDHRYTQRQVQGQLPPDMEPVSTQNVADEARAFFSS
ncbi:MAG: ATP-dependent DNA helicase [Candidatus Thermoplasmatota archaeon]|nr:ATP-dependent DNA helicase [Candidatus Thermoplasmatota archaeon]